MSEEVGFVLQLLMKGNVKLMLRASFLTFFYKESKNS